MRTKVNGGEGFLSSLKRLQDGRYYVLKKLDEGGRGVIYKAKDTVLNRVAAIKMFKKAFLSEEARSHFLREAQIVAKLNHPNIVSIHEIGSAALAAKELGVKGWIKGEKTEEEKQFFVLEFVDGMSLRNLMATYPEGKCDIQTVLRTSVDICKALQYAHSQGVLHGDIKPKDILITEEGIAKLMDFGLAKMLGEPGVTQEGMVGTVAYLAPELALGKGADAKSDLYSLGAVLYEMVTGQPPFSGEDLAKMIFGHIHDYPVSPRKLNSRVPQALDKCIMKLLEKEPGKRYQTATDLLTVLRKTTEDFLREVYVPSHEPSVVVPSPRPSAAKEIQLIDRVEEMAVLRETVDRAVHGEGGIVFLYGEAGIGKTRCARELGAYARLRGMQVLSGRCPASFRMDGIPPYVLWKEAIRNYLEDCTLEQLHRVIGYYPGEVSKLVPELEQKLRTIPQSLPIGPEHERDRLFEAVSQLFANISKETPLLVVLDDLQWTDQSSLLLLLYLTRGVYRESLLLLGAYRETYVDEKHPLSFVLGELDRERLLQSVPLKRLSSDDTSEMIKRILAQEDVPRAFCELAYEKTRGNPLFVEEVMKSLKEEEVIYREEEKWKIREVSRIDFPKTVKGVIKRRIGRLGDECQHVLTMASFIGKDFTFEALSGVVDVDEDRLLELIEKMLKTGLIKQSVLRGEDVCSFADIIVRDVVHEEVSALRHRKLHGIVGTALEKVYANKIDEHLGEIAYHFLEGGDKEKALDYFLKAGEKAIKIYANNEAVSYFQSALGLLEAKKNTIQERANVLERLGDIKGLVGEYDAGMEHWNDALLLWKRSYAKEKVARLHRKMAFILWTSLGDTEKAKERQGKALKILEKEHESVELATLYSHMARLSWHTGETDEALSWAEKALELAKKLDAFEVIADAYADLSLVFYSTGEPKKALNCLEKSLKIALDNGYMGTALRVYNNIANVLTVEENERILECYEKGFELAKKVGDTTWISWIGTGLAWMYMNMGDMNKGVSLVEESAALDRKTGNLGNLSLSTSGLGWVYHVKGEWDKSEQYYKEALKIAQKLNRFQAISRSSAFLGWHYYDRGEYAKAREYLENAMDVCEKAGAKSYVVWFSQWIAWTYIELGEIKKVKELILNLREFAIKTKDKVLTAWADSFSGMLLRTQKKWKESIEYAEKGLQGFEALDFRRWNTYIFAKILYEYARVYIERDQKGDREKALNLLNQALEIFQKIGAQKGIEKVMAKKELLAA